MVLRETIKKMNKKIILIILTLTIGINSYSQPIDFMFGISSSHFLGDLGGKPLFGTNDLQDLDLLSTRYGITTGLRFNFNKYFSVRTNIWYARVSANDKYTSNIERRGRNLNFYSNIFEGDVITEINLYNSKNKKNMWYLFGGVGYFAFNPKTRLNSRTYELRNYGTEGQFVIQGKEPYKLSALCFPHGLGYKWTVGRGQYLSLELNLRKSTTDYIDDVSTNYVDQNLLIGAKGPDAAALADRNISNIPGFSSPGAIRGDPKDNDTFFFICFAYNITLAEGKKRMDFGTMRRRNNINGRQKCLSF
jgi:hypothetical protein